MFSFFSDSSYNTFLFLANKSSTQYGYFFDGGIYLDKYISLYLSLISSISFLCSSLIQCAVIISPLSFSKSVLFLVNSLIINFKKFI